jgi:hypothetical protein
MATLLTPHARFMHVPRTGGTWATSALVAAGVPVRFLDRPTPGFVVSGHADLERSSDHAGRFTFAFVRHPLDLWRSVWAYRMSRDGWNPTHPIDSRARADDFDEFIVKVIENLPGFQSQRIVRFIGPPEAEISFVGRFESLVDDLVCALRAAGETFDETALRRHPRRNFSDYQRFPALYDRALASELATREGAIIERFYRDDPVPEWLLAQQ